MQVRISGQDLSRLRVDLAICFAHEGNPEPSGVANAALRRDLTAQMRADRFKARAGDRLVWSPNGRYPARRFLVIGLGPPSERSEEGLRVACARAARAAADFSARVAAVQLPQAAASGAGGQLRAAVEGARMGAYRFERYVTDESRREVELRRIELVVGARPAAVGRSLALGKAAADAVCMARDLVNDAPSRLTPRELASRARSAARAAGLSCRVLGRPELARIGMNALLSVARGSAEPPCVVHLAYRPRAVRRSSRKSRRKILLVGKGVTFDSGGLNLKPSESMLTMKMDMAGAAAVLAAMTALARVGCRLEVHGLLGLVENMTGGSAYKPGDILETWLGKTVEVGNTDAEGRLVLCDLLAWGAASLKPTEVVDVATLTGACVVALGPRAAGLFTRDDRLRDALLDAAREAGEKLWPMPLYDEYLQALQKGPADLRNVGGRWGGAITAALFLGEFVPRELPWAHLDIAGPAFSETDLPEAPPGGTGAGVLTLLRWLERA